MKNKKAKLHEIVKITDFLGGMSHGWGNGYVAIPKGHKLHGVDYDELDVDVHGGLTFSEHASDCDWKEITDEMKDSWIVGFDTCHYKDNQMNWSKASVIAETSSLKIQLMEL